MSSEIWNGIVITYVSIMSSLLISRTRILAVKSGHTFVKTGGIVLDLSFLYRFLRALLKSQKQSVINSTRFFSAQAEFAHNVALVA